MSTTTDRTEKLAEAALVDASSHAARSNAGGTTAAAASAKSAGPGIVPALSWPLRLLCLAGAVAQVDRRRGVEDDRAASPAVL